MGDPHSVKDNGIQRDLILLLRHTACFGQRKRMAGITLIRETHFHLPPCQGIPFSQAHNNAFSDFLHFRAARDLCDLFGGNALKRNLRVITGLTEHHLHQIFVHAPAQHKKCGKHQRSQGNSCHRHNVPAFVLSENPII